MIWSRWLRRLFLFVLVAAVFAGVFIYISKSTREGNRKRYDLQVTIAIQTAIAGRLFEATRTAEAPEHQYRLVTLIPSMLVSSPAGVAAPPCRIIS